MEDEAVAPVLVVDTADRGALLLAMLRSLYGLDLQIAGSRIKIRHDRTPGWFDVVEPNGSSISAARQRRIQASALSALNTIDRNESWLADWTGGVRRGGK